MIRPATDHVGAKVLRGTGRAERGEAITRSVIASRSKIRRRRSRSRSRDALNANIGEQYRHSLSDIPRWKIVRKRDDNKILMPIGVTIVAATLLLMIMNLRAPIQVDSFQISASEFGFPPNAKMLPSKLSPFHDISPDAFVDPPEFIRSRHFGAEVHQVITKDNYIITLHRIINPLVPHSLRSKLKPVLIQHGLFTSAFNFILNADKNLRPRFDPRDLTRTWPMGLYTPEEPFSWHWWLNLINDLTFARLGLTQSSDKFSAPELSDSLAFELANHAYDVWLGNSRGSTYSLNHTQYDYRHDWRYWDFSFHEIALYDFPAQLNYILGLRKRQSLSFIGHSQGNLGLFILQSFQPNWAQKIKPFIAVAPIAYIPDAQRGRLRPLLRTLSPVLTPRQLNTIFKGQILPNTQAKSKALDSVCVPKWSTFICNLMMTLMLGNNLKRTNSSFTPILAHHIPEGTSILNVLHFAQMVDSGRFEAFDFGPEENLRRYGSTSNPRYPIENIWSPDIAFVSGRTDTLATVTNVGITKSALKVPLLDDYQVPEAIWGHGDYMYASGAGRLVNLHMISLIDRYRLVP